MSANISKKVIFVNCGILFCKFMMNAHSPSTSRTILAVLSVLLVITALILLGLNAYMKQPSGSGRATSGLFGTSSDQAYKDGYAAARERYARLFPYINQEVRLVSGTVSSVSASGFVLTQDSLAVDPKADNVPDARTITVDKNTKIVTSKDKDPDTFRAEMDDFMKKSGIPGTQPPAPPLAIIESSATLTDIKPGMRVSVESDVDLRLLATIHALTVRIQGK